MRDYSKVSPRFWSGETGRLLRGDADAQRVAFYVMTCSAANMLGLYYLPLPTMMHEIGITAKGAMKGLERLSKAVFCRYDGPSEYVWVVEMASWQIDKQLDMKDNRVFGVRRELENHRKSPFFNEFLAKYLIPFHLHPVTPNPAIARSDEGAAKPLGSQEQEQEQEQEQNQKQEQEGEGTGAVAPPRAFGEFGYALLTDQQHANIIERLNGLGARYIDDFDQWVKAAPDAKARDGVKRKDRDPYASILSWYRRDVKEGKLNGPQSTEDRKVTNTRRNADQLRARIAEQAGSGLPGGVESGDFGGVPRRVNQISARGASGGRTGDDQGLDGSLEDAHAGVHPGANSEAAGE